MSKGSDYIDRMREPHMPVTVLGIRALVEIKRGRKRLYPLTLWCCFVDPRSGDLMRTGRKIHNPVAPDVAVTYKLPAPKITARAMDGLERQRDHVADQKIDQGLRIMPGEWHIQPETGRLFNRAMIDEHLRNCLDLIPSGLNGFGDPVLPSDYVPEIDTLSAAARINERLARANPIAGDWFFATD